MGKKTKGSQEELCSKEDATVLYTVQGCDTLSHVGGMHHEITILCQAWPDAGGGLHRAYCGPRH